MAHLSLIGSDDLSSDLWQQRREVLFQIAIEVLEFTHLLESSDETPHWSWLFEMYRQWHGMRLPLFSPRYLCGRHLKILTGHGRLPI